MMPLDPDRMVIDESRSNPMLVAQVWPECPIGAVCFYLTVGHVTMRQLCEWIKFGKTQPTADCAYESEKAQ